VDIPYDWVSVMECSSVATARLELAGATSRAGFSRATASHGDLAGLSSEPVRPGWRWLSHSSA
jgi:hypothetical protein